MSTRSVVLLAAFALPGLAWGQHMQMRMPAPSSIAVPSGGISLPMLDYGGRPIVEVTIGGKGPYRFILDTGASITVLSEALNRELGLSPPDGVMVKPANGGRAPVLAMIPGMKLGEVSINGLMSVVMPLPLPADSNVVGILKACLFDGYLLTFDYPGKTISLKPGQLTETGKSTVAFDKQRPVPSIPIRIGGQDTTVDVDTGSPDGLNIPMKFMKELPVVGESKPAKVRMGGREFPVLRMKVNAPLEVAGFEVNLDQVSFSDASPTQGPPPGQIGYGTLKNFVLTIDCANHRLQFAKP
jgi:hypothetical protein